MIVRVYCVNWGDLFGRDGVHELCSEEPPDRSQSVRMSDEAS